MLCISGETFVEDSALVFADKEEIGNISVDADRIILTTSPIPTEK